VTGPTRKSLLEQARGLTVAGKYNQAQAICQQLLQRRSRDIEALIILARIASERHQNDQALALLEQCLQLRPRDIQLLLLRSRLLKLEGRYDEAMEAYDKLLRLKPGKAEAITGKAGIHRLLGERDAGLKLLEPYIQKGREDPEMAAVYAQLQMQADCNERAIEVLERNVKKAAPDNVKRSIGYTLGQASERLGHYDRAFEAFTMANEHGRRSFSIEATKANTDRLIGACSAQQLQSLPRARHATDLPVFIVGMPRSGTTLIERIIDAHPRAQGGGELDYLPRIYDKLPASIDSTLPLPDCIGDLDQADVDRLSLEYLQQLGEPAPRAQRITDKQLGNDMALGLAELLFPQARIINCVRQPADTCFSCFASQLVPDIHPYAGDLETIGQVFLDRQRLMTHWHQVLSLPILTVQYEDLVEEPEAQSRRIIEFCGLPWDEACLSFYSTDSHSNTLSYDQVRRPLYKSSIGRSAHYEAHLTGLRKVLEGD
jgi:tetratricopeptide (TPR) repeat protein